MMKYLMKKGTHYSLHFPKFWFGKKRSMSFKVRMGKECWFLKKDSADYSINKLTGWSYGRHHKNSIRVGWVPAVRKNWIDLYLYTYEKGVRYKHQMDTIECGVNNHVDLDFCPEKGGAQYTVYRPIISNRGFIKTTPRTTWWGYYLFPYFGGKKPASVDTVIYLEFL